MVASGALMIIVVMGVAGSGKTTAGALLARELGWQFHDADDHHPPGNVAKMRGGTPLNDLDREDWLVSLEELIADLSRNAQSGVLACSTLKEGYRERFRAAAESSTGRIEFVYLKVSAEVAEERLRARRDHFMPANLIRSQFEALEEPSDALEIDATQPLSRIISHIRSALVV
jgi:gluconokinase